MREALARVATPCFLPPLLSQVQEDWLVPTGRFRTRADIAQRLHAAPHQIRVVTRYWWPPRSEHLHAFAGEVLRWSTEMVSGEWIYWVHPVNEVPLTADEAEQILGLAAVPEFIERDELSNGVPCLVSAGRVRTTASAVAVAWPVDVLRDSDGLASSLDALRQAPAWVRTGLHCVGVPHHRDELVHYDYAVRALLQVLDTSHGARFGLYADQPSELGAEVVARIRECVPRAAADMCVQWREMTAQPPDALRLPRPLFEDVQIDCSLGADASGADAPYYTDRPYVALAFDLRRPSVVAASGALVSWPRCSPAATSSGWWAARIHARLGPVLDRTTQLEYLKELEGNRAKVGEWHHYHVYNWAPPPPDMLRLVACDVRDLPQLVNAVTGQMPVRPAQDAIDAVLRLARAGAVADARRAREEQIAAHGYLAAGGRRDLTADGEELIARLPAALGDTLEIGFGYGLTARRIATRARRYVGIDLQTDQGQKLREYGGTGVVADIHWLPLASDSFDTIIADNVLEHAGNPLAVFAELARVLRPGGRVYALIPPDGVTSDYQIRTHFWKSDDWSLREAARRTGLVIITLETLEYAALGVYGCFPASRGRTCLVILERPTSPNEP
jgi:hypothetical protein